MRQYKMWLNTYTPDYKNNWGRSYGTNSYSTQKIYVGTSSVNSFHFCDTEIQKVEMYINDILHYKFIYLLDDEPIKEVLFNVKTKEIVKAN